MVCILYGTIPAERDKYERKKKEAGRDFFFFPKEQTDEEKNYSALTFFLVSIVLFSLSF
jgi:hypothetical protein